MKMKNTAKFGIEENESFIDRFKTQITEDKFGRSQLMRTRNKSQMNVSELQLPRDDTILINGVHQINPQNTPIYTCQICDRLRTICPYRKNVGCQDTNKCFHTEEKPRPRIVSSFNYSNSKGMNSTLDQTYVPKQKRKPVPPSYPNLGNRHLTQVDKIRFPQSNHVVNLTTSKNDYIYPFKNQAQVYKNQRVRTYSDNNRNDLGHEVPNRQPHYFQPLQTQNINIDRPQTMTTYPSSALEPSMYPNISTGPVLNIPSHRPAVHLQRVQLIPTVHSQQFIFYPVIHNRLVYKHMEPGNQPIHLSRTVQINKRSTFKGKKKLKLSRRDAQQKVNDFLQTTKPTHEILTPKQFKKLADSMCRDKNPHLQQSY